MDCLGSGGNSQKLEKQFDSQLHGSRITNGANLAEGRAGDIRASEASKIRVIENVENFAAQLQPQTLFENHGSGKREIKARGSGAINNAATCCSRRIRQSGRTRRSMTRA